MIEPCRYLREELSRCLVYWSKGSWSICTRGTRGSTDPPEGLDLGNAGRTGANKNRVRVTVA